MKTKKTSLTLLLLLACASYPACAKKNVNTPADAPVTPPYPGVPVNTGSSGAEQNFARIMQRWPQGQIARIPWAGYWFPYSQDGIISAARKYEQATGKRGAADWEANRHGRGIPGLQSWFGHCNGWAAAAALFVEPRTARTVGSVSFGVADQKALLSEIAMEVSADFFGQRYDGGASGSAAFNDVYPDQFFLVLTNYVGRGLSLLIDRYTGSQVWNQPVAGYKIDPIRPSDSIGAHPSAPGVHRVNVTTRLWWGRDDVPANHVSVPFNFQDNDSYESRILRFELWLDAPPKFDASGVMTSSGNIIVARQGGTITGGTWNLGALDEVNSHPDYMWIAHAVTPSTGYSNPEIAPAWVTAAFGHI